ncbi:MAG: hypothetical protein FWF82_02510 [Oscillospiraceae bacterium]|nr:hypothetical protein [Oscillospiraceae bacterium]
MKWIFAAISVLIVVAFFLPYYGVKSVIYECVRIETTDTDVTFERGSEITTLDGAFSGDKIALSHPYDYTFFLFVMLLFPLAALVILYKNRDSSDDRMYFSLSFCFVLGLVATIAALFIFSDYVTPTELQKISYHYPPWASAITDRLFGTEYFLNNTFAEMSLFPALGYFLSAGLYAAGIILSGYCISRKR